MAEKKKSASRGQMAETTRSSAKETSARGGKVIAQEGRKELSKQSGKPAQRRDKGPSALSMRIRNNRFGRFVLDAYYELRHKVTWPTFQQARNMTIAVIVLSVVVGMFLWGVDQGLFWLVFFISGGNVGN